MRGWRERDPQTAAQLRPSDPQRVLRAYEVFEATGRPLAEWQRRAGRAGAEGPAAGRALCSICRAPNLRARIAARFEAMLEQGGLEEARALEGLDPALPAAKLLGLRPLQALARGRAEPGRGAGRRPSPPRGNLPSAR